MGKNKPEVIDVEATEVEAATEEQVEVPKCEVRVGMDADGKIYFTILGSDQNLITVDGLLDYAKREMDKVWDGKLTRTEG